MIPGERCPVSFRMRTLLVAMIIILQILLVMGPMDGPTIIENAAGALTPSDPIIIEGNYGLSVSPAVRSGSGTSQDPYIISDLSIDCSSNGRGGIAIRNTTSYLIIRDITVKASSSAPGVYLRALGWNLQNIVIRNVTITGGNYQMYLYYPCQVTITSCRFIDPSGTGYAIYAYRGYHTYISNNTFQCPEKDVDIDYTYYFHFMKNTGRLSKYDHLNFRYSNFANNTLEIDTVRLFSGYSSDFQGNQLSGSSPADYLVLIADCNRLKVANNTLDGGFNSFFIYHPNTYSPVYTNYPKAASLRFEYNRINGSADTGMRFYHQTGYPSMTYMTILYNRFTNCSSYAISLVGGGHKTTTIWHNSFEYNHGSGVSFVGSKAQAEDRYYQFSWSVGGIGNFWKDKTIPDEDSDGIIDDGYPLISNSGGKDQYAISNPYFDLEKPHFEIVRPSGRFLKNSYMNLSWVAYDNISGIKKVELRDGFNPWIDITGFENYGMYLPEGIYKLTMRATDRADLVMEIERNIVVNRTVKPFRFLYPEEYGSYNSTDVYVEWTLMDHFVPIDLSYSIDSLVWIEKDPFAPFFAPIPEGAHNLLLRFRDHYGNRIDHNIPLTVDITEPVVDILYPAQGSVISNDLVNFRWASSDSFGIRTTIVQIDDDESMEIAGNSFSRLLITGPHTLSVKVFDMAGNMEEDVLSFVISQNTSLNIVSPRLNRPTRITTHPVTWEYVITNLEISSLSLIVDDEDPIDLPISSTSKEVEIREQGQHTITVRASDPAGNIVSDTVVVIIDTTPPAPDFQFPTDGAYLNRTEIGLRWNAIDTFGLDSFRLFVDSVLKASALKQGFYSIDLEPGEHNIKVQALDLAGNLAEKEITVTIDLEAPYFELLEPSGSVITEPYFTFEWAGEDDFGIDHYNFTLDDRPVEELGEATSRQFAMTEGPHRMIFRCRDLAGNVRSFTKHFTVDLTEPLVSFKDRPADHVKTFRGLIEWEIIEAVGISSIDLFIDGVNYDVAPDSRYFTMDLAKGPHRVSITVVDVGGFTGKDEFIFDIDPDPPAISKPDDHLLVEGSSAVIYWVLEEPGENLTCKLTMDGREVSVGFDLSRGEYLFTELERGNHSVIMDVTDLAGNQRSLNWDIVIEKEGGSGPDDGGGGGLVWFMIIAVLFITAAAGLWIFIYKKRSKEELPPPKMSPSKKPEKLTFGPRHPPVPAKPAHQHVHHMPGTIAAPSSRETVHKGEHGYIRPEPPKKTEKKQMVIDGTGSGGTSPSPHAGGRFPVKAHDATNGSGREKEGGVEEWGEVEEWDPHDEVEEWSDMEDY